MYTVAGLGGPLDYITGGIAGLGTAVGLCTMRPETRAAAVRLTPGASAASIYQFCAAYNKSPKDYVTLALLTPDMLKIWKKAQEAPKQPTYTYTPPPPPPLKKKEALPLWALLALGAGGVVVVGGTLAMLTRRKRVIMVRRSAAAPRALAPITVVPRPALPAVAA